MSDPDPRPHVVVIGGGFAGLHVVRGLKRAPVRVTLIDRRNHHLFQPLLYQVATAVLNSQDIAYPLRRLFRRHKNTRVLLGHVSEIDREARKVVLADGEEVPYDTLVVASGVGHNYFGNDGWTAHAPGLKSIDEALEIRRRVLTAFEMAEREEDPARRTAWLTFTVVGAGPTGVEMAGALAEIARKTLTRDFRHIDPSHARVVLVDAMDRVLPGLDPELSESARHMLEDLGVRLELGRRVERIDAEGLSFGGERLRSHTVVWAAGVKATDLLESLGAERDRMGRVVVTDRLHVPGDERVFVLGDAAHLEQDDETLPGVAPVAIQMGDHTADTIKRRLAGKPDEVFRYRDKGDLATIGRSKAVARIGSWRFGGLFAWLIWVFVHIMYLVGFRNRLSVFFAWVYAYFTWQRNARVILERPIRTTGMAAPRDPTRRETDGPEPPREAGAA